MAARFPIVTVMTLPLTPQAGARGAGKGEERAKVKANFGLLQPTGEVAWSVGDTCRSENPAPHQKFGLRNIGHIKAILLPIPRTAVRDRHTPTPTPDKRGKTGALPFLAVCEPHLFAVLTQGPVALSHCFPLTAEVVSSLLLPTARQDRKRASSPSPLAIQRLPPPLLRCFKAR